MPASQQCGNTAVVSETTPETDERTAINNPISVDYRI